MVGKVAEEAQGGRGQEGWGACRGGGAAPPGTAPTWESRVWGDEATLQAPGVLPSGELLPAVLPAQGDQARGMGAGAEMIRRTTHPLILAKKGPVDSEMGSPALGGSSSGPA